MINHSDKCLLVCLFNENAQYWQRSKKIDAFIHNLWEGKLRPFQGIMGWPSNAHPLWPSDSMSMNLPQGNDQGYTSKCNCKDVWCCITRQETTEADTCMIHANTLSPLSLSVAVVHSSMHGTRLPPHVHLGGLRLFCFTTFLKATEGHSACVR